VISSIFKIAIFIKSIANRKKKVELPLQSEKASPTCNQDILLVAVYKSPGRNWNDADTTELLSFRHKCILAGDLNAKHQPWNRAVSNPSGHKLLHLFDRSDFEISAPQYPTHHSPTGN
jgi:endonuclease/exonuclease/phosphatase family metal-dependent hydrolase